MARRPSKSSSPRPGNSSRAGRGRSQGAGGWRRRLLIGICLIGTAVGLLVSLVYGLWASFYNIREVERIPERSVIFDVEGKAYSRLAGENRVVVEYKKVSPHFVSALLAREDTRFYKHYGVDPLGITRAIVRNLSHGRVREGGSTLTQQLALNTFLGGKHNRSLHRKLLEAFLAFRIEHNYSKQEILEHYMNRIYFGAGVYGVQTASLAYFDKPSSQLTLAEAALLVGIIRSPGRFSPLRNPEGAIAQRDTVVNRMAELGMIKPQEAKEALACAPNLSSRRRVSVQANYAMDLVQQDLDTILGDTFSDQGGLRIYTTIDPVLQKAAQESLDDELTKIEQKPGYPHPRRANFNGKDGEETPYLQGAVLVLDNQTGGIRAIAGGRDYQQSTYNRALLSRRQIGSTFKPFVYAAAFEKGLSPEAIMDDGPLRPGEIDGASHWTPGNSDGTYRPPMPAAEGLIQSRNTVSIRVGNFAGIAPVRKLAAAVGLGEIPKFPSIYLGSFETSLKDLTTAYSVLPNRGIRRQVYIIERIDDPEGRILYKATHLNAPVMNPRSCSQVSNVLTGVFHHGTAASAKALGWNKTAAGKTGTTNDYRDAWFVGYTRSLTCGVWVGLDKPQTIMARGYGATLALPIWVDVMNAPSSSRYPVGSFGREEESGGHSGPGNLLEKFRSLFQRR